MSDPNTTPATRSEVYSSTFFDHTREAAATAASVVLPILGEIVMPTSVIDIGCGAGEWIRSAERMFGADVLAVDGPWNMGLSDLGVPFQHLDLEQPVDLGRRFDLAICLEVLEHLSSQASSLMVSSLVELSDLVLFSAAIPHQRGDHHVNCRWQSSWIADFADHGYVAYDVFRPRIWNHEDVAWWYRQNLLLLVREGSAMAGAAEGAVRTVDLACDLVHPAHFDEAVRVLESELAEATADASGLRAKLASPSPTLLRILLMRWLRSKRSST